MVSKVLGIAVVGSLAAVVAGYLFFRSPEWPAPYENLLGVQEPLNGAGIAWCNYANDGLPMAFGLAQFENNGPEQVTVERIETRQSVGVFEETEFVVVTDGGSGATLPGGVLSVVDILDDPVLAAPWSSRQQPPAVVQPEENAALVVIVTVEPGSTAELRSVEAKVTVAGATRTVQFGTTARSSPDCDQ